MTATATATPSSEQSSSSSPRLGLFGVQAVADGFQIAGFTLAIVGVTSPDDPALAVWGIAQLLVSGILRAGAALAATRRLRPIGGRVSSRSTGPWVRLLSALYVVFLALFVAGSALIVWAEVSALVIVSVILMAATAASFVLARRAARAAGDGTTFADTFTLRRYV
jgi:hypothetical protein